MCHIIVCHYVRVRETDHTNGSELTLTDLRVSLSVVWSGCSGYANGAVASVCPGCLATEIMDLRVCVIT